MLRLKLHLVDLLWAYYTSTFARNTVTNRTDGSLALVYNIIGIYCRRCEQQKPPTVNGIVVLT